MSVGVMTEEQCAEAHEETLSDRIARGSLPPAELLQDAIQIAACLRELHAQGLVYGALNSQAILLGAEGVSLRPTTPPPSRDEHDDVAAFGTLLREMLGGAQAGELHDEVEALAARCQENALSLQHVAGRLRILAVRLRHSALAARRRTAIPKKQKVRLRIRFSLHWRPLVNLAAFALVAK
jgi:hypothetical protein